MLKLIAAAGVATLLAGCVVGPEAGYGYGQPYYSDPGYAYGPSPVYGTVNIWGGGGGRDWDRGRRDYHRGSWGHGGGRRGDWNEGGGGRGHGDGGGHRH
ncbi:hypothetical protein [Burkholderia sp. IDO3]|uniref:hypothetical protein n=1 Tax=Burkholderia sp. IDO3 TaxID=1705310 RepID=UPI000BBA853E|nr:hypothetical protein [Burkholderia sp. IDO3]AXK66200.1 hypothetical protein DCN14_27350 [Burkholderia sp. IDO3]PCD61947.1 hypothetical protein CN645_09420 [Burkholderia sp. IDO3]